MFENETRLRELGVRAVQGVITDEEFAELVQLSRAKQKARTDRATLIAGLQESLRSQGVTIQELFSAAEIAAAVPRQESVGLRTASARPAKKSDKPARTWVRQKAGQILVEVKRPGHNGLPCRYCKG